MAGKLNFTRAGATGSVINEGTLRAALGGYIALLAPEVRNEGVIVARMGTVALAAGEAITLNFSGATLAGITVEPSTLRAIVDNQGAVLAPGGYIVLSARALDRLQGGVVKNSGRLEATGLAMKGGRIVLEAFRPDRQHRRPSPPMQGPTAARPAPSRWRRPSSSTAAASLPRRPPVRAAPSPWLAPRSRRRPAPRWTSRARRVAPSSSLPRPMSWPLAPLPRRALTTRAAP